MSIAKCQIQFKIYFLSKNKNVLLQKMSDRNKVHNISAMGIQTQDGWIVLVLIYESGIQVLDQNKTKAVEFPLRDALIVHTDQKLIEIKSINFTPYNLGKSLWKHFIIGHHFLLASFESIVTHFEVECPVASE